MIDFVLASERSLGLSSREAIYQASLKRFRPILMTTMAAMFGAVPLAVGLAKGPNCVARSAFRLSAG